MVCQAPACGPCSSPAVPRVPWHHGLRRGGPGMGACRDIFDGMGWATSKCLGPFISKIGWHGWTRKVMETGSETTRYFFSAPKGSSFAYERGILEPTEDWGVSAAPGIKVENIWKYNQVGPTAGHFHPWFQAKNISSYPPFQGLRFSLVPVSPICLQCWLIFGGMAIFVEGFPLSKVFEAAGGKRYALQRLKSFFTAQQGAVPV